MNPALIAAGLGVVGGVISNAMNAREARRNREFQERMSSTAHRREVADLRAANINPVLRSMGGASTPSGDRAQFEDPIGKGISSALAVQAARAQIKLTEAQAGREHASAMLLQRERLDKEGVGVAGGPADIALQVSRMNRDQMVKTLPLLIDQLKAQIAQSSSSAQAASAAAALDEAALTGAKNVEALADKLGIAGPALQMVLEILRTLRGRR